MPKRRKLISVDEKCRVCLGDDGCMSDIFSDGLRPKIDALGNSTSIRIKDDEKLPRNICHVCLYKLDMWVEFKEQFVRSNAMLREHLEVSELSDNAVPVTKRKHSDIEECSEDTSLEHCDAKKLKSNEEKATSTVRVDVSAETVPKSPTNSNAESMIIDNVSPKNISADIEDTKQQQVVSENTTDAIDVASSVKQIVGRRAKTTERRKASTKRWVARKKALLAATGENDTDTDSMSSDDAQLSPVQKARAKCNAEKVAETQRRMAKELKNVENNMTDYYGTKQNSDIYICGDTDSDSHKTKNDDTIKTDTMPCDGSGDACQSVNNDENKNVNVSKAKKLPNILSRTDNTKNANIIDNFLPHTIKSELIVDDATFIVTSTLVLTEPHYLNPVQTNNVSKEPSTVSASGTNQERNTDIIDAVQLRRVCPKSALQHDKKFVERCLNIEVEGTELEALQRVQSELANYIEKEIRYTFSNTDDTKNNVKSDMTNKASTETLDQQLKMIVKKTIKKNLETSRYDGGTVGNRGNNTFTAEFVKAAQRSKIFQPSVVLYRLDANRLDSIDKITLPNSAHVAEKNSSRSLQQRSILDTSSVMLGKRRSVQPAKFADYDRSPFNTESDELNDITKKPTVSTALRANKVKTYGPALAKQGNLTSASNQRDGQKLSEAVRRETSNQPIIVNTNKSLLLNAKSPTIHQNSTDVVPPVTNDSIDGKHICGVCGESFSTRNEVEIHFTTHKNPPPAVPKQTKQKMMRCKRCHEIVEARYVKLHVCNSPKNTYKCHNCEATFHNDKLLVKHLETHDNDEKPKNDTIQPEVVAPPNESTNTTSILGKKRSTLQVGGQMNNTYTCFVCDKIFVNEDILKDHLQKHCDDISEDENIEKELYQCAICGESLESEETLEIHVEKHLFDDEDDNPNLISIGCLDPEKSTRTELIHSCGQCSETFDSEMLLMLHMQAHEEEVAIAEWEKRRVDHSNEDQHVCVICDDVFPTEAELSEHLDIHNGNAHICLLCEKPFLTLEELQSHVNTH